MTAFLIAYQPRALIASASAVVSQVRPNKLQRARMLQVICAGLLNVAAVLNPCMTVGDPLHVSAYVRLRYSVEFGWARSWFAELCGCIWFFRERMRT